MQDKFDLWCLVELFGHTKIAGKCTEHNIAGTNMLRVDVPETKSQPAFTRFFGSSAIYSINPIDEETARALAERMSVAPIDTYNMSAMMEKHAALKQISRSSTPADNDDDHFGEDEMDHLGSDGPFDGAAL